MDKSCDMVMLAEAFPALVEQLTKSLRADGHQNLADQVQSAIASRITFDNAANAGYLYVQPARDLNVVETNLIGARITSSFEVKTSFWTVLDIDNFDRLVGIEILDPGPLVVELRNLASE